jgi:hypothetical protein
MFDFITNDGPGTAVLAATGEFGMAAIFGAPAWTTDRVVARPRTAAIGDKSIRRTGVEFQA